VSQGAIQAGVDIGGTFTDLCLARDGRIIAVGKALTTPEDLARAVEAVLLDALAEAALTSGDVERVVHATTLVTNALIERKGAKTALLTTEGFRDVLELGREQRFDLYDLDLELPVPLVPRYLRFDVAERTLSDGSVHVALDEERVSDLAVGLRDRGVSAVAISFLHSHTNAANERTARDAALAAAPELTVTISSEVVPEIGEYARTSTTVASAYVHELVARYLSELRRRLDERGASCPLIVMLSNGGTATLDTAIGHPIRLLESGPAAGAIAAATFAATSDDLLSFDMGGTTAKVCIIENGVPLLANEFEVARNADLKKGSGLPLLVPVLDMIEIGAGGGSLAYVDSLGLLQVGPHSAGSEPGPACYGRGGDRATVTDADLVLGYLDPDYFLGGRIRLDLEAAREAIAECVAQPLDITVEQAAWGIHELIEEKMANAARIHSAERGKDPARMDVYAFGGAGPVHGAGVARRLGASRLLVGPAAGVMSAAGLLAAPMAFEFVRSRITPLVDGRAEEVERHFAEMEREGGQLLADAGIAAGEMAFQRFADVRYRGQGREVRVAVPPTATMDWPHALLEAFSASYRTLFGRPGPPVPAEATAWRLIASGPRPSLELQRQPRAATTAEKHRRPVWFQDGLIEVAVYDRYLLAPGTTLEGPSIVEERESTLVLPPGTRLTVASDETLIVELGSAGC
jgi:N-methylhydantoinase A